MKSEDKFLKLADPEVIKYINDNLTTSIPDLILKGIPFDTIDSKLIIDQIIGKHKAKKKLPTWYNNPHVVYPPKLNLEQTSSEITAHHKSKLISGESMIDLTGGFGVDDYFFSKKINQLTYIEINQDLFQLAKYNFEKLDVNNVECHHQDSIEFLANVDKKFNWIYVDPSRRNENQKVVLLKDSLPNILEYKELLKAKSSCLMIKTSPMYDINMGYKELSGIKELHIISVKNEVKELLWIIDWREENTKVIKLYNYFSSKRYSYQKVDADLDISKEIELSSIKNYLYEFNASIMKSGLYDCLAQKYRLQKIEINSHIYTSDKLIYSFTGKIYQFQDEQKINFKPLKSRYKGKFINIISKNFPMSTKVIQKKLGCKIGGDTDYLIFTKTKEGNRVITVKKILSW